MTMTQIKRLLDNYRPLFLGLLLFCFCFSAEGQTYNPSVCCTVSNKAYGAAQAVTTDGRSWFYDATNFVMRDYNGPTEVLSYLNLAKYRSGHFPVYVHSGGILQTNGIWVGGITLIYWFKDSTGNANLVRWYTDSTGIPGGPFYAVANNLSEGNAGLIKGNLSLDLVNNTSDAQKNAAAVALTNHTIDGNNNTLTHIPNSALTNNSIGLTVTSNSAADILVTTTPAALGTSLVVNMPSAGTGSRGPLASADWNFFSGKLDSVHISNDSVYNCVNGTCTLQSVISGTGGVNSVDGTNASLLFSPTTGNVRGQVNPAYGFNWSGQHSFLSFAPIFSTLTTAGGIFYGDGFGQLLQSGAGTSGQIFQSNGGSAPTFFSPNAATVDGWLGYAPLTNVLGSTQIFVGNGSNVATAVNVSQDVSMDNAGAATVTGLKAKTLPSLPVSTQFLGYDGTSWLFGTPAGAGPGGLDGAIQYNHLGSFGGSSPRFTYDTILHREFVDSLLAQRVSITPDSLGNNFLLFNPSDTGTPPWTMSLATARVNQPDNRRNEVMSMGFNTHLFKPGEGYFRIGMEDHYHPNSGIQYELELPEVMLNDRAHVIRGAFFTQKKDRFCCGNWQYSADEYDWFNTPTTLNLGALTTTQVQWFAHNVAGAPASTELTHVDSATGVTTGGFDYHTNISAGSSAVIYHYYGGSNNISYDSGFIIRATRPGVGFFNESMVYTTPAANTGNILWVGHDWGGAYRDDFRVFASGHVGLNTNSGSDISSAQLAITSTTAGFLPPRMSNTQMNAISSPVAGLVVWNSDSLSLFTYDGTAWRRGTGSGAGPGTPVNSVQFNNAGVFGGSSSMTWNNTNKVLAADTMHTFIDQILLDTPQIDKIHFHNIQEDTAIDPANKFGSYRIAQTEAFVNEDGQRDVAMSFGWNTKTDVTPVNPHEGVLALTMESHYIPFPGGHPQFETYYTAVARNGKAIRPFGFNVQKDTGNVLVLYQTDGIQTTTSNGYPYHALGVGQEILTGPGSASYILNSTNASLTIAAQGDGSGIINITNNGLSAGGANPVTQFTGAPFKVVSPFAYGGKNFEFITTGSGTPFGVSPTGMNDHLQVAADGSVMINKDEQVGDASNGRNFQVAGNASITDNVASPSASSILDIASTTKGLLIPRLTTTQQNAISSPATGLVIYNTDSAGLVDYNGAAWLRERNGGTATPIRYQHTIFTPTTGGTVNLVNGQYNIINPAGALLALTLNLPSSPANNDVVYIKFTQSITTVTYANGTVVDGITAPTAGGLTVLTYYAGTTSWY